MLARLRQVRTHEGSLSPSDEGAQDSFEYMLTVGTIVVVLASAWFVFFQLVPQVVGHACPSVDTAVSPAASNGSCVVQGP
jgi:hypothetical protein